MTISAHIDGFGAFSRALSDIASSAELREAIKAASDGVHDAIIARLHDGRTPDSASGALAASLTVEPADDGMSATVGTPLDHGWQLEFGSLSYPATPWLEPAFHDAQPGILARLRSWLGKRSAG